MAGGHVAARRAGPHPNPSPIKGRGAYTVAYVGGKSRGLIWQRKSPKNVALTENNKPSPSASKGVC